MKLGDDLSSEVTKLLRERWTTRSGQVVPEPEDLKLSNDAVELEGTVLYADLDDSTKLVDTMKPWFAAAVYKSYLLCAARIVRSEGGVITGYDGDRIMAVFIGGAKNTSAARTALKINYSVVEIINPAIKQKYPNANYSLKHVVGIDTSKLFVARTGIRGANDLVWVGRAANYAAKLSSRSGPATQITSDVYGRLKEDVKIAHDGRNMWAQAIAREIGNGTIYSSSWWRRV